MATVTTNHKLVLTCRPAANAPQSIGITIIILSHGTHDAPEEPSTPSSTLIQSLYTAQKPLRNLPWKVCARPKDAPTGIFVDPKKCTARTPKIED